MKKEEKVNDEIIDKAISYLLKGKNYEDTIKSVMDEYKDNILKKRAEQLLKFGLDIPQNTLNKIRERVLTELVKEYFLAGLEMSETFNELVKIFGHWINTFIVERETNVYNMILHSDKESNIYKIFNRCYPQAVAYILKREEERKEREEERKAERYEREGIKLNYINNLIDNFNQGRKVCGCAFANIDEDINKITVFLIKLFLNHLIVGNMYYILIKKKLLKEKSEIFYKEFRRSFNYDYIILEDDIYPEVLYERCSNIVNPFGFIKKKIKVCDGEELIDLSRGYLSKITNWLEENNKSRLKDKFLNAVINDCNANWKTDNTEEENFKNKFIDTVKSYMGI